jgi:hypothetical protein
MTVRPTIAPHPERHSVVAVECTIPDGMTIEEWRRLRSPRERPTRSEAARVSAAVRRIVQPRPVPCDHLHESTTRYDRHEKRLSFLLVCPTCGTENVVETLRYEPRFEPHPAPPHAGASVGGTVHQLPGRGHHGPLPRAA